MDNEDPMKMKFEVLKEITDNFSSNKIIGYGTFGVVYKGVTKDGEAIAVKMLNPMQGLDDDSFGREFNNLTKLKHPNIVQLLGYCDEKEEVSLKYHEQQITALKVHRALCLEYMPNGSLQDHLSDVDQGFGWGTRYKIIKGICEGLKYLHTGLEIPVFHLDLKPANILLDRNMVPKIADFGLSRLLGENARMIVGTLGYSPPEYINDQIISTKFDIFSLGVVIMKIIIGSAEHSRVSDMQPAELIEHVCNKWRERLQVMHGYTSLVTQVRTCTDIALKCVHERRRKRPTVTYIVNQLSETEIQSNDTASGTEVDQKSDDQEASLLNSNIQGQHSPEITIGVSGDRNSVSNIPKELPLQYLEAITLGFSNERKIGTGAFGTLYKGVLPNGQEIAVKRLAENAPVPAVKQFLHEASNLMETQHENILKLLSCCSEAKKNVVKHNGRYILADTTECILCYEYASNGSIDKYIFGDANTKISWCTRFKIIKDICQGLHYMHKEMGTRPMVHLDLHPSNILLDDNMVAKIANFGLSRLLGEEQTRLYTINVVGQIGYMAPEYLYRGEISLQCDIYSLGVLITEISTGEKNYSNDKDMSSRSFINHIRETWTDEHIATRYSSLDANSCQQVKTCIELGLLCVHVNKNHRPSIVEVIDMLHGRRLFR